ncbi:tetratricopeptide repeat protein [Saccharopolyspora gloriosae]|uniref:Tetratricopeptide (TPR) repeat protein n=1 Tax=Saccharopolyspora gloriosae TaxID=455344 RepID=A0A840NE46_9PSEU|nr:NB-ARC domain-containing protein [Saccharopolyspora gloriosae]MBB5069874.1 tetratricopeptide (TPR) repeat protein [Saccharopolyspora gloriosae]
MDDRPQQANSVSGAAGGPVVQTGAHYGDTYIGTTPVRVPREIHPLTGEFVNRDRERTRARALLAHSDGKPGSKIVMFTGLPGVGKSATARHVAGEVDAYPGGELFVDLGKLRGPDGVAVSDALADCLRSLGVQEKVLPSTFAGRAGLYQTWTSGSPVLVLLDDVAEPAEVEPFVPKAPGSSVLVTSNRRLSDLLLDEASVVEIDPLGDEAGSELMQAMCGARRAEQEPAAMRELAGLCGGFPEMLRIMAAALRAHPSLPVAELVAENRADGSQLTSPFTVAYKMLPPEAAELYRRLGLVPVGDFDLDLVRAAAEVPARARRVLVALLDAHFVVDDGSGRYRMHDLVRAHARACAEQHDSAESRAATLRRIVRHCLHRAAFADLAILGRGRLRITDHAELLAGQEQPFTGERAKQDAMSWMDAERATLAAVLRSAVDGGLHRAAWQLAEAMTALYVNRRYLLEWVATTELGVRAAELDERPDAVARLRSFVSRALTDLGELARAEAELDAALPRAEGLGQPRLLASVWELVGRYRDATGRSATAVEAYGQALELFVAAGDLRGRAFVTYFLGCSLDASGEHRRALETLHEALRLIRDVPDERMAGRALTGIGVAHAGLGELDAANDVLHEAISVLIAGEDHYYAAQARERLAEVAAARGDVALQRDNLRAALAVHESFGGPRAADLRAELERLG